LRHIGIGISIDDYGTGQSTLSYLKKLPVNELKIDKSFVTAICTNENDLIMVRSTIDLAHELGLKVVAEGVEDAATVKQLRSLGCDFAQGYFIGRAMPFDDLTLTRQVKGGVGAGRSA
jgi:EAL domain-containing protein (putative c-di-GMP-specific phosphodiesterase class I)